MELSGETYLVFGKSLDGDGDDDIPLTASGGVDLGDLGTHGVLLMASMIQERQFC